MVRDWVVDLWRFSLAGVMTLVLFRWGPSWRMRGGVPQLLFVEDYGLFSPCLQNESITTGHIVTFPGAKKQMEIEVSHSADFGG